MLRSKVERRHHQRGSVLPLVALSLVGFLLAGMVLAGLAERAHHRARAQSAADAAALAGAVEGRSGAVALALANGARLVEFSVDGLTVRVVVEVEGVRAVARAEQRLEISGGVPDFGCLSPIDCAGYGSGRHDLQ